MHYSCRIKSNRSERLILKVTDGYQAQVSESICFSLETTVGLTAKHANTRKEEAERGFEDAIRQIKHILRNGFFFRVFRVFCGSFAVFGF